MLPRIGQVDTLPPELIPPEALSFMKIRTCLLAAFGLVVPLIAMFSHLLPSDVMDTVWNAAWKPASAFFADEIEAVASTPAADLLPAQAAEAAVPLAAPDAAPDATAPLALAGTAADATEVLPTVDLSSNAPSFGMADRASWPTATVRRPPGEVESPLWSSTTGTAAAPESPQGLVQPVAMTAAPPFNAASPVDMTSALTAVGAFGVTCQPTAGGRFYHCSCRVAADPTGQLVRMFHATEQDPEQAMQRLLDDVRQWRASMPGGPQGP